MVGNNQSELLTIAIVDGPINPADPRDKGGNLNAFSVLVLLAHGPSSRRIYNCGQMTIGVAMSASS